VLLVDSVDCYNPGQLSCPRNAGMQ
jgi:hypothetical protein